MSQSISPACVNTAVAYAVFEIAIARDEYVRAAITSAGGTGTIAGVTSFQVIATGTSAGVILT